MRFAVDASVPASDVRARLYLFAVGTSVIMSDVLADRVLSAIVVEDTCWTIEQQDWVSRRPHRWQRRKTAAWESEHDELYARRTLIRSFARSCGVIGE